MSRMIIHDVSNVDKASPAQKENIHLKSLKHLEKSLIERIKQFIQSFFINNKTSSGSMELKGHAAKIDRDREETKSHNPTLLLNETESIIYNQTTKEYVYVSKAPPIENLVISGGGAKGIILPGVFKALEGHKTAEGVSARDQLKNIAGSSVGALSAVVLATGTPADTFISLTGGLKFISLLGKGGLLFKDGKPLLDLTRSVAKESITNHLKNIFNVKELNEIDENKLRELITDRETTQGVHLDYEKLKKIIETLQNSDLDKVVITFSMMHCLNELEPSVFKNLTITATCRENGKTFYFDAEKTPDLDIAVACRASASLPAILKSVRIEAQFLKPGYEEDIGTYQALTFVDGGYFDNIPVNSLQNKQGTSLSNKGEEGQNLQTLALVFDETGRAETQQSPFLEVKIKKHTLFDSSNFKFRLINDVAGRILGKIRTKERYTVNKERGLERIRTTYTQRNIPLLVGDVKTTDFEKAETRQAEFIQKGFNQAMEYFKNHEDELMYRNYARIKDILEQVPQEMHAKILAFDRLVQSTNV